VLKIAMVAGSDHIVARASLPRIPSVAALSTALAAAGHEVTVHASGAGEPAVPGCRVVRTTLAQSLADNTPDIVHAHDTSPGTQAAERLGIPLVRSLHTDAPAPPAGRIIVPCTDRRAALIAAGLPRRRIDVVPYGVDTEHFTPDGPAAPKRLRHRLIMVGELTQGCGFASAVAALRAVPETELVIVGGPAAGVRRLRRFVRDLGLTDRVTFAGPVTRAELPTLLRSADVAVCIPRRGAFDVTALEAMACGVAVVASHGGGLSDTVVDGVTGLLVPPRDPQALAMAIRGLVSRRARCEQFGAAGRDRAWARYSWPRIAAETIAAYDRAETRVRKARPVVTT
jgi:glycosyltransferase involved in cell wall biosynthesis